MISANEILAASILIVDDTEANVLLLEGILRREGHTAVESTMDPRQVCEMHRRNRYDLILLDLHMPGMDGFQVMEGLKALDVDAYLPVLVITAQPGHLLRALKSGARDFISKPFDLAEVVMRVRNLLEVRLLHKQLTAYTQKLEVRNQFISETFGRYLSENIMENLLAAPDALKVAGETRTVTMMMADLRGFNELSERLPPEKVVMMVNGYLDKMVVVVLAHGGTIEGFTNDGVLGVFGAPTAHPDDAHRAVACSLAMQLAVEEINASNQELGLPALQMGVGLHSGDVTIDSIGSAPVRYGASGVAASLAARIQGFTVGGQIMISQTTLNAVSADAEVEKQMLVEPKGVNERIPIYSIVGLKGRPELTLARAARQLPAPAIIDV